MRYLVLVMFLSLFILQCKKDEMGECITHEELSDIIGEPKFKIEYPLVDMAYFNPNDSDEIIFRYNDGDITPVFDLIKYNLKTREQKIIYTGFFSNRPRWGKDNWIVLNVKDGFASNIYKLKNDGSDIIPLTTSGYCFSPEWDINSEKIIYHNTVPNDISNRVVMNKEGVSLDTLRCGVTSSSSWQHPLYVATGTAAGLNFVDPYDCDNIKWLYEANGVTQSLNGAEWLDEERIFWCHTTGIYITNIITEETEVIRETCNSHCYQRPTYAPDIDKIIVEKLERILDSKDEGRDVITLVMMNPDGTEEKEVEIN